MGGEEGNDLWITEYLLYAKHFDVMSRHSQNNTERQEQYSHTLDENIEVKAR